MKNLIGLVGLSMVVACGGAQTQNAEHGSEHTSCSEHAGGSEHASGHAHPGHGGQGMHHDFSDVERFAAMFDDPERDEWQRPDEVVALLQLTPGAIVADLGAGTGYFESYLSSAVGDAGRVLALDVEPAMVAHMQTRFQDARLSNADARVVAGDDPGLEPDSVDRILIVDTWHHLDDRGAYAAKLAQALRPGGFVLVVDFTQESPHGPPVARRLLATAVAQELQAGGLAARVIEDESLPYQYVVRADKTAAP